jgi:hypothetical protein
MAAGLGFKDFVTGEVLTAADVDGYLMQGIWVFASTAARDAAVTAPAEGNFAFTKDTNSLWYYDGATWVASGATGDIEGVTAGIGISGGGTSGTVTVTNSMATAIDAKGDLIVGTGADTFSRLAVGTNTYTLVADSTEATGLKWAAPASAAFVGCLISNTNVTVSIANNTNTKVAMDTELIDTDGFHDNSTNNTRITIPAGKAGKYSVSGNANFASNGTGDRNAQIWKNNAEICVSFENPNANGNCSPTIERIVDLTVGDYVEFVISQSSGGNLNSLWNSGQYGWFQVIYLGA